MIVRTLAEELVRARRGYPAVLVTGPRQSGKTTLVRSVCPDVPYVNLESPVERDLFDDDPLGFMARFPSGAVFDEVQNVPDLLSHLQVRIDEDEHAGRGATGQWLLTGSQQFDLLHTTMQSLAGRVAVTELLPCSLQELAEVDSRPTTLDEAVLRGGYPRLYDPRRDAAPSDWIENYLSTFVQRDVRGILDLRQPVAFDRFLRVTAARTGQELNRSALARDCDVDQKTIDAWLEVLEACYLVRRARPYHHNFGKRLVKRPKLHFVDTGLACRLLHISDATQLSQHPLRGALVETWFHGEVRKYFAHRGRREPLWTWRSNDGYELDLVLERGGELVPIEVKAGQTPKVGSARGIRKLQELQDREELVRVGRGLVLYGGSEPRGTSDFDFVPWDGIAEALDERLGGAADLRAATETPPTPDPRTRS